MNNSVLKSTIHYIISIILIKCYIFNIKGALFKRWNYADDKYKLNYIKRIIIKIEDVISFLMHNRSFSCMRTVVIVKLII